MELTVAKIRAGFSTLPRELYDHIYRAVFTAPANEVRDLDSPDLELHLKLLQISHHSQELYATSFYNAEFKYNTSGTGEPFIRWLTVPTEAHRSLIRKVTHGGDHRHLFQAWRNWLGNPIHHELTEGPISSLEASLCVWLLRALVETAVGENFRKKVFLRHEDVVWNMEAEIVEGGKAIDAETCEAVDAGKEESVDGEVKEVYESPGKQAVDPEVEKGVNGGKGHITELVD